MKKCDHNHTKISDHNHTIVVIPIDDYLQHLKSLKYKPRSLNSFKISLRKFQEFLEARGLARVQDVTVTDLDDYGLSLVEADFAHATLALYMRAVRYLFDYLEDHQEIFVNPAENLVVPKGKQKPQPIPTDKEVKRLLVL